MARLVGIDIRASRAHAAVLQSQYRGYKLVDFRQAELSNPETRDEELRQLLLPLVRSGDHVACALSGDQIFVRELKIPAAASKQLADVVPFELEAQVPVDLDELCFDYRLIRRGEDKGALAVLAVAARQATVARHIHWIESATGAEPERIAAGALPLANLAAVVPELRQPEPVAILDLGMSSSDFVVLESGRPVFARTLSVGAGAGADALISTLRQSRAAWLQSSRVPLARLYLAGAGAGVEGACPVLGEALGLEVAPLPQLSFEGREVVQGELSGFEKAIGTALGVSTGGNDLNLRKGALAYQHSYEFLKTRLPLVGSVFAIIVLSFAFSIWARSRALSAENTVLAEALGSLSEKSLGERMESAGAVLDVLDRGSSMNEHDPQPLMDAFAVLVAVSDRIDKDIIHDIEEFDVKGDKVKLVGIVGATNEAEKISASLEAHECFKGVKIAKVTKVVRSERQKYSMTFTVDCSNKPSPTTAKGER